MTGRTSMRDRTEVTRLREIVARMRQYAPSLRGTGMTASDAAYNRTLADADYLDEMAREMDAKLKAIALMVDATKAACRGECDYSIRQQEDALAAAKTAGLTS